MKGRFRDPGNIKLEMIGGLMKKGIIFDMDGTLWNSAANVAVSWNLAMEEFGYKREPLTEKDIQSIMGMTMAAIADKLFTGLDDGGRAALRSLCETRENEYLAEHGGVLYPKLRETMEKLKKDYHLYIVSNCQAGYIEAFLDYYGFRDLFEDIECFGNNFRQKSENIRLIADRNALDDAVYVGDIQADLDSARAAGCRFIHARYGFGEIPEAVPAIESLDELPEVVPSVWG